MADSATPAAEQRTCFVVMPISDREGYPAGHWDRVYVGLIAPAAKAAGFKPELATSDRRANIIHAAIVKQLVSADLVICDVSDLNPNVMLELGIRQAFDKPVVVIKDEITANPFDLIPLRYEGYNSALRFDQVKASVATLTGAIEATMRDPSANSLIRFVEIAAAAVPGQSKLTEQEAQFSFLQTQIGALTREVGFLSGFLRSEPRSPTLSLGMLGKSMGKAGLLRDALERQESEENLQMLRDLEKEVAALNLPAVPSKRD